MKTKTGRRSIIAVFLLCVIASSVLLGGCSGEKEPLNLDIDATAEAILDKVEFDDELAKLDAEAVKYLYAIDDGTTAAVYIGSGATAEEIAVFDAGSDDAGEAVLTIVNDHVANQIESYRNYVPAEIARLEKAIVIREGRYVILCVTDDANAKSAIREIIGG